MNFIKFLIIFVTLYNGFYTNAIGISGNQMFPKLDWKQFDETSLTIKTNLEKQKLQKIELHKFQLFCDKIDLVNTQLDCISFKSINTFCIPWVNNYSNKILDCNTDQSCIDEVIYMYDKCVEVFFPNNRFEDERVCTGYYSLVNSLYTNFEDITTSHLRFEQMQYQLIRICDVSNYSNKILSSKSNKACKIISNKLQNLEQNCIKLLNKNNYYYINNKWTFIPATTTTMPITPTTTSTTTTTPTTTTIVKVTTTTVEVTTTTTKTTTVEVITPTTTVEVTTPTTTPTTTIEVTTTTTTTTVEVTTPTTTVEVTTPTTTVEVTTPTTTVEVTTPTTTIEVIMPTTTVEVTTTTTVEVTTHTTTVEVTTTTTVEVTTTTTVEVTTPTTTVEVTTPTTTVKVKVTTPTTTKRFTKKTTKKPTFIDLITKKKTSTTTSTTTMTTTTTTTTSKKITNEKLPDKYKNDWLSNIENKILIQDLNLPGIDIINVYDSHFIHEYIMKGIVSYNLEINSEDDLKKILNEFISQSNSFPKHFVNHFVILKIYSFKNGNTFENIINEINSNIFYSPTRNFDKLTLGDVRGKIIILHQYISDNPAKLKYGYPFPIDSYNGNYPTIGRLTYTKDECEFQMNPHINKNWNEKLYWKMFWENYNYSKIQNNGINFIDFNCIRFSVKEFDFTKITNPSIISSRHFSSEGRIDEIINLNQHLFIE